VVIIDRSHEKTILKTFWFYLSILIKLHRDALRFLTTLLNREIVFLNFKIDSPIPVKYRLSELSKSVDVKFRELVTNDKRIDHDTRASRNKKRLYMKNSLFLL
jgi:hypothetical protein